MKYWCLTTKKPEPFSTRKTKFYFTSESDADVFVWKLRNHMCHVEFDKTEEDVILPENKLRYINDDPIKRAESNLSWGFNFDRMYGDDKPTAEENEFIHHLMNIARNNR